MKKVDVIILLGGGTDGTLKPILYTKERLAEFPRFWKSFPETPLIVTGGYSTWMKSAKYSEADVMKNHLVKKHDFPSGQIFLEKRARDTIGNAYYSKQIVKKHPSWKRILIVTTDAHVARSRWIFKKLFGKKYVLSFLGLPSKIITDRDVEKRQRYEVYITKLYAKYLKPAGDGDDRRIMSLLKKFHPAYSNSHLASEIRKEILETKQRLLGYTKLK